MFVARRGRERSPQSLGARRSRSSPWMASTVRGAWVASTSKFAPPAASRTHDRHARCARLSLQTPTAPSVMVQRPVPPNRPARVRAPREATPWPPTPIALRSLRGAPSASRRSWHCAHARAKVTHPFRPVVELGYAQRRHGRRETRLEGVGLITEENVIFGGPAVVAWEEKIEPPVAEERLEDGAHVHIVQRAIS